MTAHHDHAGAVAPVLLLLALAGYLTLAVRAASWKGWRTAVFAAGLALVAAALMGPIAAWAATDFRGHMVQHLLIGMLAPLGLVLGAPMTLLLRSLPAARARRLTGLLRRRAAHAVANPVTALVLSTGGMIVLYCTPLYRLATVSGWPHAAVHAHFLLSGCLFAWVIAGPDPARAAPPSWPGWSCWAWPSPRTAGCPSSCTPASPWTCPCPRTSGAAPPRSCTTAATSPSCSWPSPWSPPGARTPRRGGA